MTDAVARFLFEELDIHGSLVQLESSWQAMTAGRGLAAVARDLLGEMAAVTTLLGNRLKTPGRLSFQLQGHGAIRLMVVDCDQRLHLRAMAKAPALLAPAPVPELLGDGRLTLTLQPEDGGPTYQSFVPIAGAAIAAIFEHYLAQSEQQPARLWLHADAASACGLLLQKLPHADERDADGWQRIQQLAATLRPHELSLAPAELLTRLFPEETIRLFTPRAVRHHAPRDEQKVLDMLRGLGRAEVESILAEHGEVAIHDEMGNHDYRYGPEIVERLFGAASRTLH